MRKTQFILFGQDMSYLGTEMIPAYTPEGRRRTEKGFCTHQDRPPKELAVHGINEMDNANRYLDQAHQPTFSAEFLQLSVAVRGFVFVLRMEINLDAILYEKYERTVITDNCATFEGKTLQIPADKYRCHYVKVKMMIHRYGDGSLAIFHGLRKLADYDKQGKLKETKRQLNPTELPTAILPPCSAKAAGEWLWITPANEKWLRKAKVRRSPPA